MGIFGILFFCRFRVGVVLYQLRQEGALHGVMDKLLLGYDSVTVSVNLLQDVIHNVVNVLLLGLPVEHLEKSHHNPVDLVIINRSTSV